MKLYLAHPTEDRYMIKEFLQPELEGQGHVIKNPFIELGREDIFYSKEKKAIYDMVTEEQKHDSPATIVGHELMIIDECDGLFAYINPDLPSVGVSMEIFYNSSVLRRGKQKTFVFVDTTNPKEYLLHHPWLKTFAIVSNDPTVLFELMGKQE